MLQSPTLNPVSVELWHPKSDAVEHEFRHRFETRSTQFEVLVTLQAQCHFFSKDSLRRRQELGYIRSLGYIRVRKEDLVTLGELPIEEEWVAYKLLFPVLALVSTMSSKHDQSVLWMGTGCTLTYILRSPRYP